MFDPVLLHTAFATATSLGDHFVSDSRATSLRFWSRSRCRGFKWALTAQQNSDCDYRRGDFLSVFDAAFGFTHTLIYVNFYYFQSNTDTLTENLSNIKGISA